MKTYRIAAIPGDGIGKEVLPEGVRVLDAAAAKFGFRFEWEWIEWASCDWYLQHGQMMPDDWFERLRRHDAIYFGAVGWPATVPDHVSLWGSLLQFRRRFDQYISLRPARLMPGMASPLAGRKAGDIDIMIVRENTEGEYSNAGGRMFAGTEREIAIQETVMSRHGVDRVLRYAFELARTRGRHLTSATKSNGISITMPFWDERVAAIAADYRDVKVDQFHIDILCAHFVQRPDRFDVVVGSNLFGDIFPISAPPAPAPLASRPRPTSTPSAATRRCSSRCMARRPTSPAATSPTRSARSGAAP